MNGFVKSSREVLGQPGVGEDLEAYDRRMYKEDPGYAYLKDVEDGRRSGAESTEWDALRWQMARNQRDKAHPTLVGGVPFQNREFFSRSGMPSNVVVNIGGYGEGGGNPLLGMHSMSPNPVLDGSGVPKENVLSFQQSHGQAAQTAIDLLEAAGVPTTVIGHSYGGDTAAHLAKDNPSVPVHAIDPVGMLDPVNPGERPANLSIYRPNRMDAPDPWDWIAAIGQRYRPDENVQWYSGGHVRGTPAVVDSIMKNSRPVGPVAPVGKPTPNQTSSTVQPTVANPATGVSEKSGEALTPYEQGFLYKCAERGISSPEELDALMAKQSVKQAESQAYDRKKWPDYDAYVRKTKDRKIELVERLVREHYAKQHPWGAKTEKGRFLSHDQVKNRNIDDIVIRGGKNIMRQRRGMCHELSNARLKMLRDHGIDARRLFAFYGVGQDTDGLLGHSFVMFKGDDGKYHFASPGMRDRPRKNFGRFDDLNDAVRQYIAAIKTRGDGGLTDNDYVEIHDTTDINVPDKIKYKDFVRQALKKKLLYMQGK